MTEPEDENDLLGIEVDPDDYASTAAGDIPTPTESRTYQSRADFEAQKATYSAKIDGPAGKTYTDLVAAVPALRNNNSISTNGDSNGGSKVSNGSGEEDGIGRVKLTKKQIQLLHYAVGELYFDCKFGEVVRLCSRVRERCVVVEKLGETLQRWTARCGQRMGE